MQFKSKINFKINNFNKFFKQYYVMFSVGLNIKDHIANSILILPILMLIH